MARRLPTPFDLVCDCRDLGDPTVARRFAEKFVVKHGRGGGCWQWTGAWQSTGYGRLALRGVVRPAHVVAFELLVGPVPEGMHVHHRCRNSRCVNPAHLQLLAPEAHAAEHAHRPQRQRGRTVYRAPQAFVDAVPVWEGFADA